MSLTQMIFLPLVSSLIWPNTTVGQ